MRLSKEKAADNRQHIIESASRLFRQHGFNGVGLADLMKAAGFTHGGFYNHFSSKEALASEAASLGLKRSNLKISATLEDGEKTGSASLKKFVERYLSSEHRDNRGSGCTIASLGCDAGRESKEIQASFAKGIEEELAIFARYFAKRGAKEGSPFSARAQAIHLLAQLVGAVILARAVAEANPLLSDEILQNSRRYLLKRSRTTRSLSRVPKKQA
jgi:TetR/AcrR family transcriptional regulator, transcriptional repressor for nem operon